MKIYLAGLHADIKHLSIYKPLYVLESFYYIKNNLISYIKSKDCKEFLLDSGAFTFMNNPKNNINWDDYLKKYAEFINENKIDLFFELDIDKIVGIKEVERLRNKLETLTNKRCIPVWHKSRGLEYWKDMIKKYNYVAIGGFAIGDIKKNQYKNIPYFLNEAKENNCQVHGLGFTSQKDLKRYKFYSVDSTTWMRARFGDLAYFKDYEIKIYNNKNKRVKGKESTIQNLKAWIKFQKYAENNL